MKKSLWTSALISGAIGSIFGGIFMRLAWQHNPQSAFHSERGIEWSHWLAVGGAWALVLAVPIFALLMGLFLFTIKKPKRF